MMNTRVSSTVYLFFICCSMFGGMEIPQLDSDGLKTQAQHIWSMLDDMAANDPAAYRKFIDRQMKEGKEAMSPPKPHMCVLTCTYVSTVR